MQQDIELPASKLSREEIARLVIGVDRSLARCGRHCGLLKSHIAFEFLCEDVQALKKYLLGT